MEHYTNGTTLNLASRIQQCIEKYKNNDEPDDQFSHILYQLIDESFIHNPWFIQDDIIYGLQILSADLISIHEQLYSHETFQSNQLKNISFLIEGHRPFDGFSEIIYTALQGFNCKVIVPPDSKFLFKKFLEMLNCFGDFPIYSTERISQDDAIINFTEISATMNHYLRHYPILSLNQEGRSVLLTGNESDTSLRNIVVSVCRFFGRSRLSTKAIFVPENFDIERLNEHFGLFDSQLKHHKYFNNYEYRKSAMLVNRIPFIELGPLIVTEHVFGKPYISLLNMIRYESDHLEFCYSHQLSKIFPLKKIPLENNSMHRLFSTFEENYNKVSAFLSEIESS